MSAGGSAAVRVLRAGSSAVLVEVADLAAVLALAAALRAAPPAGVVEVVPAARTVLLRLALPVTDDRLAALERDLAGALSAQLAPGAASAGSDGTGAPEVEIAVHYDGEDLAEVAALCSLSPEEVVTRHTRARYTVAFTGFAPGFAYLAGGDPALRVPRRSSPRTRVPAGAVALAGEFSGVYPRASPGGWQLLGSTDAAVWDAERAEPALLRPGTRVRFTDAGPRPPGGGPHRPTTATAGEEPSAQTGGHAEQAGPPGALEVLAPGALAVVEDLGRPGHAALGVCASGAADRAGLRRANRTVGNAAGAAVLEVAGGGQRLRARTALVVALAGAPAPMSVTGADGGGRPVAAGTAVALDEGDELAVAEASRGARSYLAVRGGLAAAEVLGSRASDVLAGLGPPPLRAGDVLALADRGRDSVALPALAPPLPAPGEVVVLDVVVGPRQDWFTPAARELLTGAEWTVTPRSNRVGLRLAGEAPLQRARTDELPSEGTVRGALQVPADGQPVLFLADHPVTGGYPVIACVADHHLDLAAQVPAGARVRFRAVTS